MPAICNRLKTYLDDQRAPYETIHHREDFTAQETAADTGTPGREFAKTVVLRVDGQFCMAVLPAHHMVDLEHLREQLAANTVELAHEPDIRSICPDCEVGAEPPFGNLYDVPVYLAAAMIDDEQITFKAGSHEDVIRMAFDDFRRLVQPQVLDFSESP